MVAVLDLVNKTFYTCPIQRAHLRYASAGEIRSHALRAVKHFAKRGCGFFLLPNSPRLARQEDGASGTHPTGLDIN